MYYYQSYHNESIPLAFAPPQQQRQVHWQQREEPPTNPLETDPLLLTPVRTNRHHHQEEEERLSPSGLLGRTMVGLFVVCLIVVSMGPTTLPFLGSVLASKSESAQLVQEPLLDVPLLGSQKRRKKKKRHKHRNDDDNDPEDDDDDNGDPPAKPTDQIQTFLQLWQDGKCNEIGETLLSPHFEYQVTTFGVQDEDDTVPLIFNADQFQDQLCEPYAGVFVFELEANQHNNLGPSFGTIRVFGSEYYPVPGQDAPCLTPYYITIAVSLDADGRIAMLQEMMHNLEDYNAFVQVCNERTGAAAAPTRHRLLKSKKRHNKRKTERRTKDEEASAEEEKEPKDRHGKKIKRKDMHRKDKEDRDKEEEDPEDDADEAETDEMDPEDDDGTKHKKKKDKHKLRRKDADEEDDADGVDGDDDEEEEQAEEDDSNIDDSHGKKHKKTKKHKKHRPMDDDEEQGPDIDILIVDDSDEDGEKEEEEPADDDKQGKKKKKKKKKHQKHHKDDEDPDVDEDNDDEKDEEEDVVDNNENSEDTEDHKEKKHKKKDKHKHEEEERPSNLDIAKMVSNYFWMGKCDEMRPYLAPEFVFRVSIKHPTSLFGIDGFVDSCKEQLATMPQAFYPTVAFQDGNTVTMSGPFLMMVAGDCPVFGKESSFMSFTESDSSPMLTSIFTTTSDSFMDDIAACQQ